MLSPKNSSLVNNINLLFQRRINNIPLIILELGIIIKKNLQTYLEN